MKALPFLLVVFATTLVHCEHTTSRKGRWEIRELESLPDSGGHQRRLYRVRTIGRLQVDDLVTTHYIYDNDCVMYSAYHGVGPANLHFYGVCGDRMPLRLEGDVNAPHTSVGPGGLVDWTGFAVENGITYRTGRKLTPEQLRALSAGQPSFASDWRERADSSAVPLQPFRVAIHTAEVTDDGLPILEVAITNHDEPAVRSLANNQNVNRKNKYGYTPLYLAVSAGNAAIVKTLILAGADVNASEGDSRTSLDRAVEDGNPEIVAALLDAGATVTDDIRMRAQRRPSLKPLFANH